MDVELPRSIWRRCIPDRDAGDRAVAQTRAFLDVGNLLQFLDREEILAPPAVVGPRENRLLSGGQ